MLFIQYYVIYEIRILKQRKYQQIVDKVILPLDLFCTCFWESHLRHGSNSSSIVAI
jgi:hypothetical protein